MRVSNERLEFSERRLLELDFEEWRTTRSEEAMPADCAMNVVSWLDGKGFLRRTNIRRYLEEGGS